MKLRYFYCILFFITFICLSHLFSKSKKTIDTWPLQEFKIIEHHLNNWDNRVIGINAKKELILLTFKNQVKYKRKKLYKFKELPYKIKCFSLEKDDYLIVSIFKKRKEILFLGFSKENKRIYKQVLKTKLEIIKADLQTDDNGYPSFIIVSYDKLNYLISRGNIHGVENLYRIEYEIDEVHFNWASQTIHFLHKHNEKYYWGIWSNRRYYRVPLPYRLTKSKFVTINKITFLLGIDTKGGLQRFRLTKNKLLVTKMLNNIKIRYATQIIPIVHNNIFSIFMPSPKTNEILYVHFSNFIRNIRISALKSQPIFWSFKIHPISFKKKLHFFLETELQHVYIVPFKQNKIDIYNIKWDVVERSPKVKIRVSWNTDKKNLLYSYILNSQKYFEPIAEPTPVENNNIVFSNLNEKLNVLHLKVYDSKSKLLFPTIHIPIYFSYSPEEPKIEFLNTISQDTFAKGQISFFIKNYAPLNYYVELNKIPKYTPRKKIDTKEGYITMPTNFDIGWYYLHIQSQDRWSKNYSVTNHIPFSIKPFDPFVEKQNKRHSSIRKQIEFILKAIENNKGNLEKLNKLKTELEILEKELTIK